MQLIRRLPLVFVSISLATCFLEGGSVTGDLRIHRLRSEVFQNERNLRVWLPPDYDDPSERENRYPVLYLNDGQNLFDDVVSQFSGQEWRVDEIVTELIENGALQSLVVVGIDNAGKRMRPNEYLPWEDVFLSPPHPHPKGKEYPAFLAEEVMPFIEKRYRVRTDPVVTAVGGSSYGALIALYAVTSLPGRFGMVLAESPSLYVDDARLLEENQTFRDWPARVYLGVGTHEGRSSCAEEENEEAVRDVRRLEGLIRLTAPSAKLKVVVEPCGLHGEEAYSRRLPEALRFLFGKLE